jgi:hypothetical protein
MRACNPSAGWTFTYLIFYQLVVPSRLFLKGIVQRILTGVNTYYAQIIRAGKLEVRPLFFSNFKGTPSQKRHKTIFSGLKISKMALSGQSDATALFSAVRYTLCYTYIDFLQSVNSGKSI